jgi:hypothetical protein
MCYKSPAFLMPFHEDGHISGRNMVEVYGVCDILLYVYVHLLLLISYNMRCLYEKILQHTNSQRFNHN